MTNSPFYPTYLIADGQKSWHEIWGNTLNYFHSGVFKLYHAFNTSDLKKLIVEENPYFDVIITDTLEMGGEFKHYEQSHDDKYLEKIISSLNDIFDLSKDVHQDSLFIISTAEEKRVLFPRLKKDDVIIKPVNGKKDVNNDMVVNIFKENKKIIDITSNLTEEKHKLYLDSFSDNYFEDERWFYDNYSDIADKFQPNQFVVVRNKHIIYNSTDEEEIDKYISEQGWSPKSVFVGELFNPTDYSDHL